MCGRVVLRMDGGLKGLSNNTYGRKKWCHITCNCQSVQTVVASFSTQMLKPFFIKTHFGEWHERQQRSTHSFVVSVNIHWDSPPPPPALPSPPLPSPQDGWLSNDPFREILLRMTRKPRPHQFIGLMGKRSMGKSSSSQKSPHVSFPSADLLLNAVLSVLPQQMHRSPTKVSIISHSLI